MASSSQKAKVKPPKLHYFGMRCRLCHIHGYPHGGFHALEPTWWNFWYRDDFFTNARHHHRHRKAKTHG